VTTDPRLVRTRAGDAIRSHAPSLFFLAFAITWLAWAPYILSFNGLGLGFVKSLHIPAVLGTIKLVGAPPIAYLGPLTAAFVVTAAGEGPGRAEALGLPIVPPAGRPSLVRRHPGRRAGHRSAGEP